MATDETPTRVSGQTAQPVSRRPAGSDPTAVLEALLANLEARLGGSGAPELLRGGDEADRVIAHEERDGQALERARHSARIVRVRFALERIRLGVYGVCLVCEEPIGPARLLAIPEVERCLACQDQLERTPTEEPGRRRRLPDPEEDC